MYTMDGSTRMGIPGCVNDRVDAAHQSVQRCRFGYITDTDIHGAIMVRSDALPGQAADIAAFPGQFSDNP